MNLTDSVGLQQPVPSVPKRKLTSTCSPSGDIILSCLRRGPRSTRGNTDTDGAGENVYRCVAACERSLRFH